MKTSKREYNSTQTNGTVCYRDLNTYGASRCAGTGKIFSPTPVTAIPSLFMWLKPHDVKMTVPKPRVPSCSGYVKDSSICSSGCDVQQSTSSDVRQFRKGFNDITR